MNASTRRVLRTEVLRGAAPLAVAAIAVTGVALLIAYPSEWAGRWAGLADSVSAALLVLAPLAATVAAWQAGRERRRRVVDQVQSAARPAWQRVGVTWAAVTLGSCAGLAVVWLAGAALVAPVATYPGRAWGWTLAVAVCGLAVASAFGTLVGRVVPWRLVAPLAGGVMAALLGRALYVGIEDDTSGVRWLSPTGEWGDAVTYLGSDLRIWQLVWLAAVTVTLLAAATTRRWWRVAVPAAVSVVAAVPIVTGPGVDRLIADPAAQELVCAPGDGPQVCLSRVNAFLLDEVTTPARDYLTQWDGVAGGYGRAVDDTSRQWQPGRIQPDGTAYLYLGRLITWTGGLNELTSYNENIYSALADATVAVDTGSCTMPGSADAPWEAGWIAAQWAGAHPYANMQVRGEGPEVEPHRDPRADRVAALNDAERRAWLGRFLEARDNCDTALFAELLRELE